MLKSSDWSDSVRKGAIVVFNPRWITVSLMLVLSAAVLTDRANARPSETVSDTTEVKSVVSQFHASIADADSAAVAKILSDDAIIIEGGRAESKMQYLSHHFHSDAAYLGAMTREPLQTKVSESGDTAWVMSITRLHGTFRDREVDSNSAELLVLRKTETGWKIVAVHWSSGRRSS